MYNVTSEETFQNVNQIEVFYALIPWFKPNTTIKSPFNPNGRPSFHTIWNKDTGVVWFKDYREQIEGTAIDLVKRLNFCDDKAALNYLNQNCTKLRGQIQYEPVRKKVFKVQTRDWKLYDLQYWQQFGISLSTLEYYGVKPIRFFWIDSRLFHAKKLAYTWPHGNDLKIYQPENTDFKIIGSRTGDILQGYHHLPETGDQLVLASSYKDGMTINSITGIPFIAPHSETALPSTALINELKQRFKKIVTIYDNDVTGYESALKLYEYDGLDFLLLPVHEKDPSDFVKSQKMSILTESLREKLDF